MTSTKLDSESHVGEHFVGQTGVRKLHAFRFGPEHFPLAVYVIRVEIDAVVCRSQVHLCSTQSFRYIHTSRSHASVSTECFKKVTPPKTFRNIFTSVKSFCVKFRKFVGNSYPYTCTNFCRFILIFHQIALFFPRVPIVFTLSSFE